MDKNSTKSYQVASLLFDAKSSKNEGMNPALTDIIPARIVQAYGIVPLKSLNNTIIIAAEPNYPLHKLEDLQFTLGKYIKVEERDSVWIEEALSKCECRMSNDESGTEAPFDCAQGKLRHSGNKGKTGKERSEEEQIAITGKYDDTPIVQLVNDLINKAIKINASDIHIEPLEKELRIRYRRNLAGRCKMVSSIHR